MNKTIKYIILIIVLTQCSNPQNNERELIREEIWKIEAKKSKQFADSLNDYINYDSIIANVPGFVNDSIHPYIEIVKNDTQTIYSIGGIFPNTRTEYWKLTKSPRFGKRSFYHKVSYQGKIENLSFIKRQYIKDGANLYFVRKNINQLILNDSLMNGLINSLQIKNTKDCLFDKTEITGKVVHDGQTYYRLFLTGTCRKTGLKQNLIIDQNLRVIEDINLRRTVNRKIKNAR